MFLTVTNFVNLGNSTLTGLVPEPDAGTGMLELTKGIAL
jgi:hypothetical protein